MARDFYTVLAVPRNATEEQIRQRFRELARTRHPDRFQGAEKARAMAAETLAEVRSAIGIGPK